MCPATGAGMNPPGGRPCLCPRAYYACQLSLVYCVRTCTRHVRLLRSDAAPHLDIQRVAIRCSLGT